MKITDLSVTNFRNIKNASFAFSPSVNIFGGNNAQGKTNLVEAISAAVGKSFRTNHCADMLNPSLSAAEIDLDFTVDNLPDKLNSLKCRISKNGIVRKINGVNYKDAIKLYPQLKAIVFIPNDLDIVTGDPEGRRTLADETADMMNKIHGEVVYNYYRALKQKNALISELNEKEIVSAADKLMLLEWNGQLAKAGVNVLCGRVKYLKILGKYAAEFYSLLNGGKEKISVKYNSTIVDENECFPENYEKILSKYIERSESYYEKELIVGHTLTGVHRDDVEITVDGRSARDFASRGQVRSIAVALRLAQAKMFREKWGETPIIILDDVLSELDEIRRDFILKHIVNSQVFITGCNNNDFLRIKGAERWEAEDGEFKKIHSSGE